MIFGDLVGLTFPDIYLRCEGKPRKILTQKTCSDRGSNPVPVRDWRACYRVFHSGGHGRPTWFSLTNSAEMLFLGDSTISCPFRLC